MSDKPTDKQIIEQAKQQCWTGPIRVEIDDDAPVSHSEDDSGAYVQAWIWVDFKDVDLEEDA